MTSSLPSRDALPPHVRELVSSLVDPACSVAFDLATWEVVVRVARSSQLLGTLAARLELAGRLDACPEPVRNHLRAAAIEARFLRHMALVEIGHVARAACLQRSVRIAERRELHRGGPSRCVGSHAA